MSKKMHKKPSRPGTRRPSSAATETTPRAAAAARPRKSAKPDGPDSPKMVSSKVLQRGNRPGISPAKRGTSTSASGAAATDLLAADSKAPDFRLPRDGGATVSLADFRGRHLVLFFYPRANTPGCTKEAMDFSRLAGAFSALGADVVGVSADPPKAQEAFRRKRDLTVPLLSDERHAMLEAYGVWGKKTLYGKVFDGIFRTTVLIGPDGRIINVWRNVKVDGHAEAVLKYIENL